jgi:lipopolysaccharide/colanic/teichoic acid biosynthesis glycosyltransferase
MTRGKRALDVVASAVGLVALSPVLAALALLVFAGDGRTPFFRQERVGRRGQRFRIWKFRTMVQGDAPGPMVTAADDPRITPIGRVFRRLKLDELPQLINVLRGEMSLVGPRPEVPRYVARYSPAELPLLECVPGLTDPAALLFRGEEAMLAGSADPEQLYVERIMPAKARVSIEYAGRATLMSDVRVILSTLTTLGRHERRASSPLARAVEDGQTCPGAR